MHFSTALDFLKDKAVNTKEHGVYNTLNDIYAVMLISSLSDGKRWAAKIETVVKYVEAGNYAFCHQEARRILNKRVY
jgi:hypothetical protein